MTQVLKGMSHVVILFNTVEKLKRTGVAAMASICFGADDCAITQILYRIPKGNSTPRWVLPTRSKVQDGKVIDTYDIFTGKISDELLSLAGRAVERLKQPGAVQGKVAGRTFRVTKVGVEEVVPEAPVTTTNATVPTTNTVNT